MTIDGVAATTEATFDVVNPATGAPEATAPDCTPQQLDAAMDSAAKAYRDWRSDEGRRRELLRQCADALMAAAEDVAPILTLEQGKPLGEATFEVYGAAIWFQYYADLEIPRQVIQDDDAAFVEVVQ
ncbi:MAG TPA: aldehyde dehydrogenase, partial [Acidimicrobiaceae bacterium]|nr:aldehyde dehydrogenase [Acidimicrobiaceae bacterium]